MAGFLLRHVVEQRLIRSRLADRILVEEYQPLEVDFLDADVGSHLNEGRQLSYRLFQAGEPGRHAWLGVPFTFLQLAKSAHIAEDTRKIVLAADLMKALGIGGVERDAQLVESGIDQCTATAFIENGAVGIEQRIY